MENINKPTREELINYYISNRKYFDELANFYYQQDRTFYESTIFPIYNTLKPGEVKCAGCNQNTIPFRENKITSAGWICIVFGICSAFFGIFFFPMFIGISLILVGISLKEYNVVCPICRNKIVL